MDTVHTKTPLKVVKPEPIESPKDGNLEVHLQTNVACVGNLAVSLSPMQTELLHILLTSGLTSNLAIEAGLYGNSDSPKDAAEYMSSNLHRNLAPLGWGICTYKLRGRAVYRLADGLPRGAMAKGKPNNTNRNYAIISYYKQGYHPNRIATAMKISHRSIEGVIRRHRNKQNAQAHNQRS